MMAIILLFILFLAVPLLLGFVLDQLSKSFASNRDMQNYSMQSTTSTGLPFNKGDEESTIRNCTDGSKWKCTKVINGEEIEAVRIHPWVKWFWFIRVPEWMMSELSLRINRIRHADVLKKLILFEVSLHGFSEAPFYYKRRECASIILVVLNFTLLFLIKRPFYFDGQWDKDTID